MRRLTPIALVVAVTLMAPSATATRTKVRGPFLLVSLPSLGTVTWRCDPERKPGLAPGLPGLALGFRSFRASATDRLSLQIGRRTVLRRVVQPGEYIQLPYLRSQVQKLEIVQFSGAGTLRALVTVNFITPATATYCYPYLPPRIDVRVGPRR
jgi:hypothetical protein